MANFLTRWVDKIADILVSWIVWPIVAVLLILGVAAICLKILIDVFLHFNPLWALLAIVALAVGLASLVLTILE
jgi:hypothetical protein